MPLLRAALQRRVDVLPLLRGASLMAKKGCVKIISERATLEDETVRRCERCGAPEGRSLRNRVTVHHRLKRSHLPPSRMWEPSNCVILCGDGTWGCHGWVEHNPDAAREEGFHVRAYEDPREVPVKLWHTGVHVHLDDQGQFDLRQPVEDNA